jgi:hypothetical protein
LNSFLFIKDLIQELLHLLVPLRTGDLLTQDGGAHWLTTGAGSVRKVGWALS